jgi:PTH1 family peptidyl-tRNA hydrolase
MKLIIGLGNPGRKYEKTRHNAGFMVLDALASKMVNGQWSMVNKFQSLIINHQSLAILAKPQTFMNESGKAVAALATFYLPRWQAGKLPATSIYVIHDDLDIALGKYKIQKGKGPREHNGIISIDKALGTRDYWHVRVGIENRKSRLGSAKSADNQMLENSDISDLSTIRNADISRDSDVSGEDYVLQNFIDKEVEILDKVVDKIVVELVGAFSN